MQLRAVLSVFLYSVSLALICIIAQTCKGKTSGCIQKLIVSITAMKWLLSNSLGETTLHTQFNSWFLKVNQFSYVLRKVRSWHYYNSLLGNAFVLILTGKTSNISSAAGMFCILAHRLLMWFERTCLKYKDFCMICFRHFYLLWLSNRDT